MAVSFEARKRPRPPLDAEGLERLALFYVGRYATTRSKLRAYLGRKIKERGWAGERSADMEGLVERLSALGYIDDRAFAAARTASLQHRGFGKRRVEQDLKAAGISESDSSEAREQAESGSVEAAIRFARRKRIGPFAPQVPDRDARQKAFAAMMRAGHAFDIVRQVLDASPDELAEM